MWMGEVVVLSCAALTCAVLMILRMSCLVSIGITRPNVVTAAVRTSSSVSSSLASTAFTCCSNAVGSNPPMASMTAFRTKECASEDIRTIVCAKPAKAPASSCASA